MDNPIVLSHDVNKVIVPQTDDKQIRTRMRKYYRWLERDGRNFLQVDLAAYRDHLLESMKPASVGVYLATVRNRYRDLIADREFLYSLIPDDIAFSERKAYVDEIVERIENGIAARRAPVKTTKVQDRPDSHYLRLEQDEVVDFLSSPDMTTLKGVRDSAVIALLLATGCRAGELTSLHVKDLRVWFGDELALHIRHGKGRKERLIPYGELEWLLEYVDFWMELAGIESGYVFRRVYKNGKSVGKKKLSEYAIELILKSYPIQHKGETVTVKPHDLRRTYARRAFDAGLSVYRIQKNMGHESEQTTKTYIGDLSASERRPPAIYGNIREQLNLIKNQAWERQ